MSMMTDEELLEAKRKFDEEYRKYWTKLDVRKPRTRSTKPKVSKTTIHDEVYKALKARVRSAMTDEEIKSVVDDIIMKYLYSMKKWTEDGYYCKYLGIGKFYSKNGEMGFQASLPTKERKK